MHCCPIELAELQPQACRRHDKGTMFYDAQGNETKSDGMVHLQFTVKAGSGKQVSVIIQASVSNFTRC